MSKTLRAPSAKPAGRGRRSVKLFVSYSHQNRVWMERLAPLLNGFKYDDRMANWGLEYVHAWHDQELKAGDLWDGEIRQQLEEMDVFVALVSHDFTGSSYIREVELKRAQERYEAGEEIEIVPILLYDANLRPRCAFLHQFQPLPAIGRWWSSYPDVRDAHRSIDDGLWGAIAKALKRKAGLRH
jgi:hypothetical protein